jgi:DNA-binding NarL/FixJ family response regulator
MSSPIRVLIVEDQPTILAQQERLLRAFAELEIVGTARDGERALELIGQHQPDVVLLDLGLPDIDGIEITRRVKEKWPVIELLIFTIFDDQERVLQAVRAGASGYLLKGMPAERIVEALVDVAKGGSVIQPQLARTLLLQLKPTSIAEAQLTPREAEILNLIAKGMTNRRAAETLGLSRSTVRTHLEHIYSKLEVSNRTEAVTEAIKQGLIDP